MKILFIRHSLAIERNEWFDNDLFRPLSEKGIKRAKKFFGVIKRIYPEIDYIITSKAIRAKQTAEILKKFYVNAIFEETSLLYPGADIKDLKNILESKSGIIAIIGHEPDLGMMIKDIMHSPNLKIKLSKPSLVEIEDNVLRGIFSYKHFKDLS